MFLARNTFGLWFLTSLLFVCRHIGFHLQPFVCISCEKGWFSGWFSDRKYHYSRLDDCVTHIKNMHGFRDSDTIVEGTDFRRLTSDELERVSQASVPEPTPRSMEPPERFSRSVTDI